MDMTEDKATEGEYLTEATHHVNEWLKDGFVANVRSHLVLKEEHLKKFERELPFPEWGVLKRRSPRDGEPDADFIVDIDGDNNWARVFSVSLRTVPATLLPFFYRKGGWFPIGPDCLREAKDVQLRKMPGIISLRALIGEKAADGSKLFRELQTALSATEEKTKLPMNWMQKNTVVLYLSRHKYMLTPSLKFEQFEKPAGAKELAMYKKHQKGGGQFLSDHG